MLDPQYFRNKLDELIARLRIRNIFIDENWLKTVESERKKLQTETQTLQNERNVLSKEIGLKKAKGEDTTDLFQKVQKTTTDLKEKEVKLEALQKQIWDFQAGIPNLPHESVPSGKDASYNLEIRKWGEPNPFGFEPLDHSDLGKKLHGMDFDAAATIAGARFVTLAGPLARLHRALIQFMLDTHTQQHGYQEVYVPYLVNADSLFGTGQLPKFEGDLFSVNSDPKYYLIPTAEVPVTNLVRDKILNIADLPLKFVCHTPCFRSEAGSYGKDTRGMIRQHQFEKVELVQIAHPDKSYQALEELTTHAEAILQKLELPYRVVTLCGGDMGFSAAKTYDIEVWLPSQKQYREISSCSNFESFQARRLQVRWRASQTEKPDYAHTLNGSGLAVGRTLIAIMENFQDENGNISIPRVLQPYMGGMEKIIN